MLALETKQSGGKPLPHSDLRGGGECFQGKHRAAVLVAGACECGNEPSGSVKCAEFLD